METRHDQDPAAPVRRAHLTGVSAPSPPVPVRLIREDLRDVARHVWTPTWDLPTGIVQRQRTLQHPVCLVVVTGEYARLYGPSRGMSEVELSGRGWAFGVMLRPGAGRAVAGGSVVRLTDTHIDLADAATIDGRALTDAVRGAVAADPSARSALDEAQGHVEVQLERLVPLDRTGHLANRLVELVESDRGVTRVDQLAARVALSERQLQRVCRDALGLTPKWLVQRRRLHDAAEQLKAGPVDLAALAHELGYADQAHFTNDWSRVTGGPPGAFLADQDHGA